MFSIPKSDFLLQCISDIKEKHIQIQILNVFYTAGPNYIQSVF